MRNKNPIRENVGPRFRTEEGLGIASLLAVLIFMLESCTTLDAHSIQYAGAPRFPASNPDSVKILREEPTGPNERLGEIVVDASVDPAPSVSKVEERLRTEAGKLGADAVVVVYDSIQALGVYAMTPWWNGAVPTKEGRQLIGVAIKYLGPQTEEHG
ncbi:MAG: hypothetical protein EPO39_01370 [Candidatus Manganitrophaceae bacterium]|nr:MAG: hypothetical protein EPO39_01370 [Candidatus Manganitrophaceae bacterium]